MTNEIKELCKNDEITDVQVKEMIPRRIKRGEIYMADLNPAKGSEQGGIRPVLVMNNDDDYRMSNMAIVLPITTSWRKRNKTNTHIRVRAVKGLPKDSVIICEQIRTIDKQRLFEKIGDMDERCLIKAERALIRALELRSHLRKTERNG